jgi:Fe-S cluster biogenesis protein NfuA
MVAAKDEIVRVVREVLAPLVRADGGDLYLVSVEDTGVSLHVTGRFSGCPGNTLARRRIFEPPLVAVVPGITVTLTSGPLIPAGASLLG